jgi:hypothetical protein
MHKTAWGIYPEEDEELSRSTELVSGDSKIDYKHTNNLVKLAHCGRHRFMNPVAHAMETNSKKLGTPSPILLNIKIKSRQQAWWIHSTTQNIEYKHYTRDKTPFYKSVKAQKSTSHTVVNHKYPSNPNHAAHIVYDTILVTNLPHSEKTRSIPRWLVEWNTNRHSIFKGSFLACF